MNESSLDLAAWRACMSEDAKEEEEEEEDGAAVAGRPPAAAVAAAAAAAEGVWCPVDAGEIPAEGVEVEDRSRSAEAAADHVAGLEANN